MIVYLPDLTERRIGPDWVVWLGVGVDVSMTGDRRWQLVCKRQCTFVLKPLPGDSPPMPPVLPHDVWLNIAGFLPTLALRALYPVNASLLHIALDARYRQVSFIYWDDRLLRNLIRLRYVYIHTLAFP